MNQNQRKTERLSTGDTSSQFESIPLIDSILVDRSEIKEPLQQNDVEVAMQTSVMKEESKEKGGQEPKESRLSTQYVDESQSKVKGSYGCEFATTESVSAKPREEKLSRTSSIDSDYSFDKGDQNAEDEKDQNKEPKIGSLFFSFVTNEEGVTIKVEDRDTFDLFTYTVKNEVLQQGLLGDLFESPEDFGNEVMDLVKKYPNKYLDFDEDSAELTLYQCVEFGFKKARKPLLEMKLQNQNEFLKPLELCKSSSSRLFAKNPTDTQKLFLKVTDQMILLLEELEQRTQNLHTDISKIEVEAK